MGCPTGSIVETGSVTDIFTRPREDYTRRLLESVPNLDAVQLRAELHAVVA
jgi:peptide/nickel transport system permease protein